MKRPHEEIVALSSRLGNLHPDDVQAALRGREFVDLARDLERAGAIIAAKRRERGELKRAKKGLE